MKILGNLKRYFIFIDMTSKQSHVMNIAQIIGEEELTNRSLEGLIDFRIIAPSIEYMVTN
ncbi:MAG: hypothetical protein R3Y29_04300 [bacterium]